MNDAGRNLSGFGSSLTPVSDVFKSLGTFALDAASEVNAALRDLRVGTGATGEELKGFQQIFRDVFSSIPASAKDVALAIGTLNDITDATGATLQNLAVQNLNLARITGEALKPQIEATSHAFQNWHLSTGEMSGALDFLFKVSQSTGVSVTTLAQQVGETGATARAAGISFEQSAALIGQLDKSGLSATNIMQGFAIALRKIKDKGNDPTEVLNAVIEKIKGTGDAGKANAIAVDFFGRSALGMGDAIKAGKLNIDEFMASLKNNKETINNVANETSTFGNSMEVLKNQTALALQPLGVAMTKVLRDLKPLLDGLVGALKSAAEWFSTLSPTMQKVVGGFVLLAGAAAPFLIIAGKVVSATGSIMGAMTNMNIGLFAARAGWFALAAAAVWAVGSLVDQAIKAGSIGALISNTWNAVGDAARKAKQELDDAPMGPFLSPEGQQQVMEESFKKATTAAIPNMKKAAGGAGKETGKALLDGFKEGSEGFSAALDKVLSADLAGLFDRVGKKAKAGAQETAAALKSVVSGINEYFASFGAGITTTAEQMAVFPKAVIRALGEPAGALKQAREDQVSTLIQLNADYRAHGEALKAVLKDGVIVIEQTGRDTVDVIKDNASRAILADGINKGLADNNSLLQATLNERNQIILKTTNIAVESAKGVASGLNDALGKKMFEDLRQGIAAQGEKVADAFVSMWENVRKEQGIGAKETARLATEAFKELTPDIQAVVKPAFDQLIFQLGRPKAALEDLKLSLDRSSIYSDLKTKLDIRSTIDSVISDFERLGTQLGKTGQELESYVENGVRSLDTFKTANQQDVEAAIEAHKRAAIQLPGIWEEVFSKVSAATKKQIGGVLQILDAIPGKLNSIVRTIEDWVGRIDSVLHGLHKIFSQIPDGLSDAFSKVIGIFKQTQSGIAGTVQGVSGAWGSAKSAATGAASTIGSAAGKMSSTTKTAFGAMAGAAASFTTALGVTAATGSKTMGIVSSLFTSTLAGIQAGLAFGPVGGAIVGGISLIGGILGSLFGGPSKAEKAKIEQQKQLQLQQTQQTVLQAFEDTEQKILATVAQARGLLESIRVYASIGDQSLFQRP